jgi:hypothetical protein
MERVLDSHWLWAVIVDCNCNGSANKSINESRTRYIRHANPSYVTILYYITGLLLKRPLKFQSKILTLPISSCGFYKWPHISPLLYHLGDTLKSRLHWIYTACSLCRLIWRPERPRTSYQQALISPGKLKVIHSVITWSVSQSVLRHRMW